MQFLKSRNAKWGPEHGMVRTPHTVYRFIGELIGTITSGSHLARSHKAKDTIAQDPITPPLGTYPKEVPNTGAQGDMGKNVLCNTLIGKMLETNIPWYIWKSIGNKYILAYLYSGIIKNI